MKKTFHHKIIDALKIDSMQFLFSVTLKNHLQFAMMCLKHVSHHIVFFHDVICKHKNDDYFVCGI